MKTTNCARITNGLFGGIGVGVLTFGIFIAAIAVARAVVDSASPVEDAPDVVERIHQIKIDAILFGVAVFFLILADRRPALLKRVPLAILVACFCLLIAWKFLFFCFYVYLRTQSIDLYKVLQDANPR